MILFYMQKPFNGFLIGYVTIIVRVGFTSVYFSPVVHGLETWAVLHQCILLSLVHELETWAVLHQCILSSVTLLL